MKTKSIKTLSLVSLLSLCMLAGCGRGGDTTSSEHSESKPSSQVVSDQVISEDTKRNIVYQASSDYSIEGPTSAEPEETVTFRVVIAKDGYLLDKVTLVENGETEVLTPSEDEPNTFSFVMPDKDVQIQVTLKEKPAESYDVTLVKNNGEENEVITVKPGDLVSTITVPTKENYFFDAWYSDETFTTKVSNDTAINSNLTLYARFVTEAEQFYTFEIGRKVYVHGYGINDDHYTQINGNTVHQLLLVSDTCASAVYPIKNLKTEYILEPSRVTNSKQYYHPKITIEGYLALDANGVRYVNATWQKDYDRNDKSFYLPESKIEDIASKTSVQGYSFFTEQEFTLDSLEDGTFYKKETTSEDNHYFLVKVKKGETSYTMRLDENRLYQFNVDAADEIGYGKAVGENLKISGWYDWTSETYNIYTFDNLKY